METKTLYFLTSSSQIPTRVIIQILRRPVTHSNPDDRLLSKNQSKKKRSKLKKAKSFRTIFFMHFCIIVISFGLRWLVSTRKNCKQIEFKFIRLWEINDRVEWKFSYKSQFLHSVQIAL